jgi:MFS family permease
METVSVREIIKNMNLNVKLAFAFSFLTSLGRGIWMGNVLSAYIYYFSNKSNITLGQTSLAMGLTMTVFVFPAGYFADKFRRDILLKIASVFGIAGLAVILFGNSMISIFVALSLWGLFQAITRPALESILADSIESGRRSRVYSWLHFVRQVAQSFGPFISVFLFFLFGDEWELPILKNVILVGILVTLVSIIVMEFFNDKKSLGKVSESLKIEEEVVEEEKSNGLRSRLPKGAKLIPYILVGSNVIIGIGAGMTIKYFPIFFIEVYNLKPMWVQVIMGITAVATGITGLTAQKLSMRRGRPLMIFLFQLSATLCLFALIFYPTIWLMVPLFVARGSLMNAGQPLSRSILMDVVPKKNRGKWNSLETLAWGLWWNFSALIGGYIVGDAPSRFSWTIEVLINQNPLEGYIPRFWLVFLVTACVYTVGLIPLLFLIPLVKQENFDREEDKLKEKET